MTLSTVQSQLLSREDRERVEEALRDLEKNGNLPESVREPLLGFLRLVADGRSATILENSADLTSTQAAEVLGVSRPFLNRLLDEGRIPYHRTGTDRRIAVSDVLEYRKLREETKQQRAEAARSYHARRVERLASAAGVSADEAEELGFG